jgi:hypothetical protein
VNGRDRIYQRHQELRAGRRTRSTRS